MNRGYPQFVTFLAICSIFLQNIPNLLGITDRQECNFCRFLVKTFEMVIFYCIYYFTFLYNLFKGLERTRKLHFGGGNTDWEERKLGSFKNRLFFIRLGFHFISTIRNVIFIYFLNTL